MAELPVVQPGDPAPPATMVIFGGAGDLSRRLLMPALVNLTRDGLIGDALDIRVVSRGPGSDRGIRKHLTEHVDLADAATKAAWTKREPRITYQSGDFDDDATYAALADRLRPDANAAFYLACSPSYFGVVADRLAAAGLLDQSKGGFRRLVVEKPFGHDLNSARALNAKLLGVMGEDQIYRIDHFLGKETVQNILTARFGNAFFEAIWNARYIDHVQITAAETVDVGTRGAFYDATGALRDMVPNHLFQLLAMVGMEPPNNFAAESVRDEKAKLLNAVRVPSRAEAGRDAVRGRYTAATVAGKRLKDFVKSANIAADSRTETYVALKLMVDSWRWAGVPFYLRTGKAMRARDTEIVIRFKPIPLALFRAADGADVPPNTLTIQIQPDEGIGFDFIAKRPGPVLDTAPVRMDFRYADAFEVGATTGYETLLYDLLIGDPSLFQRADMVERGWEIIMPILNAWKKGAPQDYRAGSDGPADADTLLERDGRAWHAIG